MANSLILLSLGVFYFIALSFSLLFSKTRVPDVLLLVLIGIGLGPGLHLLQPSDLGSAGRLISTLAVTVILFESGLSLNLFTVLRSFTSAFLVTIGTSLLTMAIIAVGTVALFGGNWALAFLTGAALCSTSASVVIPIVRSLQIGERASTILILESAITDVISIGLTFGILAMGPGEGFRMGGFVESIGVSFGGAFVIGVFASVIWLLIWNRIRKLPATLFTTIAWTFIVYGAAEIFQTSGAIAVLSFGLCLANFPGLLPSTKLPKVSPAEHEFYREIVYLVRIFFFVYVGISTRITSLTLVGLCIAMVLIIYFARAILTRFLIGRSQISSRDASIVAILIPKGLAAVVLASVIQQHGIAASDTIQQVVFSVVILSIVLTAVLVRLVDRGPLGNVYRDYLKSFGAP